MRRFGVRRLSLAVIALSLAVSLVRFVPGMRARRVLAFPAAGADGTVVEVRYLPRRPAQGSIPLLVDELLLGPQAPRARALFAPGTKAEFCFRRGRTLYLGLSADALFPPPGTGDVLAGIALLRRNIRRNFPAVAEVALFIGGKYVE